VLPLELEKTYLRRYRQDGGSRRRAAIELGSMAEQCILTKGWGSWVFLSEVVTGLDLEPDPPLGANCGQCEICLHACPTDAFVAPYVLDNRRCISYLTIELRGSIPVELRPLIGNHIFGCDICQQVCPVNTVVERRLRANGELGVKGERLEVSATRS
jgi:epoxyqueuosine reductase